MSRFSVYLKELLDQRGEPIARVAKNAGIERTSIHKALKDERMLSYTALKKLTSYLQLTLSQVWELNQYYEMLLQGEDIYRLQEAICDLLGELSLLHFSDHHRTGLLKSGPDLSGLPRLISGRSQAEAAIQSVFQWEVTAGGGGEIDLYLPARSDLLDRLSGLWEQGACFDVRQLVTFYPNHSGKGTHIDNIGLLRHILPASFISGGQYKAYYYFENGSGTVHIDPLPYFIITPHVLIQMDPKLSVVRFQTDTELIDLYKRRFSAILTECQALNTYSGDPERILEDYMRSTDEKGYYTLMTQPCLGHYYTRERILKQIRKDIPEWEKLAELGDRRFARLRELQYNYYTIFLEDGLRQLARDGAMADVPRDFVEPFDVKSRLMMFKELREDIASDVIRGCIADPEKLPVPPYLTFTSDPRWGVHIYAAQSYTGGPYACNLHIGESSIGQTFCEFIRSLPNSKFVYPKERTLDILDELIGELTYTLQKEGTHV